MHTKIYDKNKGVTRAYEDLGEASSSDTAEEERGLQHSQSRQLSTMLGPKQKTQGVLGKEEMNCSPKVSFFSFFFLLCWFKTQPGDAA